MINFIACFCSASHLQTWSPLLSHNTMGFVRPFQEHKPFLCLVKVKVCLNQIALQFSLSLFLIHTSNGCGKLGNPCFEVLILNSKQHLPGRREMSIRRWCGERKHPRSCQNTLSDLNSIDKQTGNRMLYVESLCIWFSFWGEIWHVTKYFKELIKHKQHCMFTVLMFYYICLL